jgi:hypothetical protein
LLCEYFNDEKTHKLQSCAFLSLAQTSSRPRSEYI